MSKCLSDYHGVQANTQRGWVNWYHHVVSINHSLHIAFTMVVRGHYSDVITSTIASQITSLTSVYWTVYWDADQRKYHSSASLAFVRGIHRWPVNSPHKGPVTRKMFPFDDVIMDNLNVSLTGIKWFRCHGLQASQCPSGSCKVSLPTWNHHVLCDR